MPEDHLDELLAWTRRLVQEQGEVARRARLSSREATAAASAASHRAQLALLRARGLSVRTGPPIPTQSPTD